MIGRFKCEMCKNFLTSDKSIHDWKCKAFPEGIPETKIAYITRDPCINCNNGIGFEHENPEYDEEWKARLAEYWEEYVELEKHYHELHKRDENS